YRHWILFVHDFFIDDGPPGFLIDAFRPGDAREGLGRNELARDSVEHVEETVLIRLHDYLAGLAVDVQLREYHLLHAVVVPLISGNHLIVPLKLAGSRTHGNDGGHVEIVVACAHILRTKRLGPRLGIACADIQQVALGVVGYTVPNRSATA